MRPRARSMWICPKCGRQFLHAHQWHSCGRFSVASHLRDKDPRVVALYERLAALVRQCGPVRIVPTKTRIGFQAGVTFAGVAMKRKWLEVGIILGRRVEDPRFTAILSGSPESHAHFFRVVSVEELDQQLMNWLREAYNLATRRR